MFRYIIEAILAKIAADLPEFKTVALFNNQFDNQDQGLIDSFRFPALFISFPEGANYKNGGSKVQLTDELTIRFYIADSITKGRAVNNTTILDLFDLKQKVFSTFQGYKTDGINTFNRILEETDETRTNYYTFVQDWTVEILDDTKYIDGGGQEVTLTLQIDDDVVINPATVDGIRTAKDVNDG